MWARVFRDGHRDRYNWCIQVPHGDRTIQLGTARRVVLQDPCLVVDPALRAEWEAMDHSDPAMTNTHAWAEGELWAVDGFHAQHPRGVAPPTRPLPPLGDGVEIRYNIHVGRFEPVVEGIAFCIIEGPRVLAYTRCSVDNH